MTTQRTVAPPTLQEDVRELTEKYGIARVAIALGLSRESTTRVAGGFEVRPGTLALAQNNLQSATNTLRSSKSKVK